MNDISRVRNFAIIAHVDHGKSTLADRLLELTGVVKIGAHDAQMLDRNPISRERGITIKLAPVRMEYGGYVLNLIDTPGHVDFSYEVDRTLACVEGVVLLVDATTGIQAQTISNAYKAIEKSLTIIAVVNKIDLPSADAAGVKKQIIDFLGIPESEILTISAKTGVGVQKLLDHVIVKVPSPTGKKETNDSDDDLRALIFDSYYDVHRGVIAFSRIVKGGVRKGSEIRLYQTGVTTVVTEVGLFRPELIATKTLSSGEIGYIVTNLKDIHQVSVGDTVLEKNSSSPPLPGYKKVKPMVFASLFPTETKEYLNLKQALEKLSLNDSSLVYNVIHSTALGAGFRVGFLGLLHADVVRERLEREFSLSLILTPPRVEFKHEDGFFFEPLVKIFMLCPASYVGAIMGLCENYRAKFLTMDNKNQTSLVYEMPMSEMIAGFFDDIKSATSGFASLDWEFLRFEKVDADNLMILLNGQPVEEFSEIVVRDRALQKGIALVRKLRELIPRQQYEVKLQASFKGKIIASERISPYRKDVLVKGGKVLGSGDVGRKRKLLERQKEGKKKMKMIGKVEIPKEAFMKLLKIN